MVDRIGKKDCGNRTIIFGEIDSDGNLIEDENYKKLNICEALELLDTFDLDCEEKLYFIRRLINMRHGEKIDILSSPFEFHIYNP
jgi:hypothetical protein